MWQHVNNPYWGIKVNQTKKGVKINPYLYHSFSFIYKLFSKILIFFYYYVLHSIIIFIYLCITMLFILFSSIKLKDHENYAKR
jgi:hypothetical protein